MKFYCPCFQRPPVVYVLRIQFEEFCAVLHSQFLNPDRNVSAQIFGIAEKRRNVWGFSVTDDKTVTGDAQAGDVTAATVADAIVVPEDRADQRNEAW